MMRVLFFLAAVAFGLTTGEFLDGNYAFRHSLGRLVRHDELVALVGRHGIYARDLARASLSPNENRNAIRQRLIDLAKLADADAKQSIAPAAIDRQVSLLRDQFPDTASWNRALQSAGMTAARLRGEVADTLRGAAWIEARIAGEILPNDSEIRNYYEQHADSFRLPPRVRASHLFLAAPIGYPDQIIEAKHDLIDNLSARLHAGTDFSALVAEASEDEATKNIGGDLNYFAEDRMLPEFFKATQTLALGQISAPIRSRLGFHLLRVDEKLPATELSLAQATPEITTRLENEKRRTAVAKLIAQLPGKIEIAAKEN